GEMTAMIAHELNQPLGAILNNADAADIILEMDPNRTEEVRAILADIRADDTRASDAIRRIRALVRRKEMHMQSLDLNETTSDVLKLLKGDALRRRIDLQTDLDDRLPEILGDRVHLQQVVLNLVANAMDAMRDTPISHRRLMVRTTARNAHAELSVEDTGCGIA